MQISQAVILAAGRGRRMGAVGTQLPKCLLPLAGRALIDYNLDALRQCGIDQVLLVSGWQAQQLAGRGCQLVHNPRWADTQMVRSLLLADSWLGRAPTLLLYGDCAYAPSTLRALIDADDAELLLPGDRNWQALWSLRFQRPLEDAETWRSADGWLRDIGARADDPSQIEAQFMGLLRLTPAGWVRIGEHLARFRASAGEAALDRLDLTGLLRDLLAAGQPIASLEVTGGWVEIDSAHDLAVIERAMHKGGFSHDIRG